MICLPLPQWPWPEPDDNGKQADKSGTRDVARRGSSR
jgi:hypothetical protein